MFNLIAAAKMMASKPLTDAQLLVIERAQQCWIKGYISKEEAMEVVTETVNPAKVYYL